jgi:predicted P-loop ATPase/GTPase
MQVRYKLGQAAFAIQASTAIREAIKALVEGLGINPVSAFVADIARKIAGFLRKILKILKMVNRFVKDVVQQVLLMKAIIEFIQELPDYLRRIFDRCLREIFRELATFVFELMANYSKVIFYFINRIWIYAVANGRTFDSSFDNIRIF